MNVRNRSAKIGYFWTEESESGTPEHPDAYYGVLFILLIFGNSETK